MLAQGGMTAFCGINLFPIACHWILRRMEFSSQNVNPDRSKNMKYCYSKWIVNAQKHKNIKYPTQFGYKRTHTPKKNRICDQIANATSEWKPVDDVSSLHILYSYTKRWGRSTYHTYSNMGVERDRREDSVEFCVTAEIGGKRSKRKTSKIKMKWEKIKEKMKRMKRMNEWMCTTEKQDEIYDSDTGTMFHRMCHEAAQRQPNMNVSVVTYVQFIQNIVSASMCLYVCVCV